MRSASAHAINVVAPTPTDVEMRLLSAEREFDCIWAADIADEQPIDRPRSFQWKRPVPAIEKIVAHAFALMRRHKAQGLEVTHVVALAPDGSGSIRSNVMPGALAELVGLADMLEGDCERAAGFSTHPGREAN